MRPFGLGGIGPSFITILGAGLAVMAFAADGDRTLQALQNLNESFNQTARQLQQLQEPQQVPPQPQVPLVESQVQPVPQTATVENTGPSNSQRRTAIDAQIQVLRSKITREQRSLADTESRLDQAARSGGSTIALSRTVTSQRSIIQNYENQISRLEAQKSQ